jgi:hypothetical protein
MAKDHTTTLLTAEDHRHPPYQSSVPLALAALNTTTCAAISNHHQHKLHRFDATITITTFIFICSLPNSLSTSPAIPSF